MKIAYALENNRNTDLELLNKYNTSLWDSAFQRTSVLETTMSNEISKLESNITEINRKRKWEQENTGQKITQLQQQYGRALLEEYQIGQKKALLADSSRKMLKMIHDKNLTEQLI